ncbi:MAG: hypothetical protein KatS3mg124_0447 [Porticoccaceae bacterium]|nr:MAG: hypothetical protein KatS3mg124_0447 [Porticoccaceae bacterium]
MRARLLRDWRNAAQEWPLRRLLDELPALLGEAHSPARLAEVLEGASLEELRAAHRRLVEEGAWRVYAVGNLDRPALASLVARLPGVAAAAGRRAPAPLRVADLAPGAACVQSLAVDHQDAAAVLYLQGRDDGLGERARMALLEVMTSAPFYTRLRTEQQLGYAVGVSPLPLGRVPGLAYYVQSPRFDEQAIRDRVEAFFAAFGKEVAALTEEDLERYRRAVLARVEEAPRNLDELAARHLESLDLGYWGFDFRARLAAAVRAVGVRDLKAAWRQWTGAERQALWLVTDRTAQAAAQPLASSCREGWFALPLAIE